MGGRAKLAKKAVAPARRNGSFFLNSLKAILMCLKNNFDLFIVIADICGIYPKVKNSKIMVAVTFLT